MDRQSVAKLSARLVMARVSHRYEAFEQAREALLNGDTQTGQEAAGRMPTKPGGFVGSFEYAGELNLDFGGNSVSGGGDQTAPEGGRDRKEDVVEDYIRHLHLNNGTGENHAIHTVYDMQGKTFPWTIFQADF